MIAGFHSPWLLLGLLLLPLLVAAGALWRRRLPRVRFSASEALQAVGPGARARTLPLAWILQAAGLGLLIVALARPQAREAEATELAVEGIDVLIALDLSTSMEAGDFRPRNRLHVAKEVLSRFVDARVNDRIGLVVFAGEAYTQAPLTLDYGALQEIVARLKTGVIKDGTAIGDAITVSLSRLRASKARSRVVILITDGDNNSGRIAPMDAARMAQALEIPVFTILVGKGGMVPFPVGRDLFGNLAWRQAEIPVDPELLQEIASSTGGAFYQATDAAALERGLQRVLDAMERSELMDAGVFTRIDERFDGFLAAGLLVLAVHMLLMATVWRSFP